MPRFQSTHPRGVRPNSTARIAGRKNVSIHAPAWGATPYEGRDGRMYWSFQSTHPRGVRPAPSSPRCHGTKSFNPRTRVGCDRSVPTTMLSMKVSIHAPAWGATMVTSMPPMCVSWFQSTHPRGVRRRQKSRDPHRCCVSIHAPAWGATRPCSHARCIFHQVSIHAPAWGATSSR